MIQFDIFEARKRRDEGIATAVNHADAVTPDWSSKAYTFLMQYIQEHEGSFMAEDVRQAAEGTVPEPPDSRSWGAIFVKANKAGKLQSLGIGKSKDKKSHCRLGTIWIKI